MSYTSLTSWSLHRSLGPLRLTEWDAASHTQVVREAPQPSHLSLLELPAQAAKRGIRALDVCHFHFPRTDSAYLESLQQAFKDAGVTFYTLLVDYGDISSHDTVRRQKDMDYIKDWIGIAEQVGATRVRVVAGESPSSDSVALDHACNALKELVEFGTERGVRIVTENFRSMSATAENCLTLVGASEGSIGLVADFGNFRGDRKYDELAQILPKADNVHAKAHYDDNGLPDQPEFEQCMALLGQAGYDGPITVVFDGPGDEWAGIERVQRIVEQYL